MPLAIEEARRLATAWAEHLSDLPQGWKLSGGHREGSRRLFRLMYTHPEYGAEFVLMRIRVSAVGEVRILVDYRTMVRAVLSKPEGLRREYRFFTALSITTPRTPEWLLRVKRARFIMDLRGVDGTAHARIEERTLKVPFQLKTWKADRDRFLTKYPEYKDVVPIIVLGYEASEDDMRMWLYTAVGEIRGKIVRGEMTLEEYNRRRDTCLRAVK